MTATTAKTPSATVWARIRPFCSRAESSVPRTQIQAISTMSATVSPITTGVDPVQLSSPTASSVNRTPTSAREPSTRTPVIVIAQPPIQPADGPIARVTQENVVPQSGSARLRAANAPAMSSIGTNDASSTPGAWTPTRATTGPRTAASE